MRKILVLALVATLAQPGHAASKPASDDVEVHALAHQAAGAMLAGVTFLGLLQAQKAHPWLCSLAEVTAAVAGTALYESLTHKDPVTTAQHNTDAAGAAAVVAAFGQICIRFQF